VVLSPQGWQVSHGRTLTWPVEDASDGLKRILPGMRTDIVLDHPEAGRRIVVDTKFNPVLGALFGSQKLKSPYLQQLYAYRQTQAGRGDPLADRADGVLLQPAASPGQHVDEWAVIQGHRLRFLTVDLTADPQQIRRDLLKVVEEP